MFFYNDPFFYFILLVLLSVVSLFCALLYMTHSYLIRFYGAWDYNKILDRYYFDE